MFKNFLAAALLALSAALPAHAQHAGGGMLPNASNATAAALLAISTTAGIPISSPSVDTVANGTLAIGDGANCVGPGSTNWNSVCVGYQAGQSVTTGSQMVAIGFRALQDITTGLNNQGVGWAAGAKLQTGNFNNAFGHDALAVANGVSTENTCMGEGACFMNGVGGVINHDTAFGAHSLFTSSGSFNTAVGSHSLLNATTGQVNAALGFSSGLALVLGAQDTLLGANAGVTNLVNGSRVTLIGYGADVPVDQSNFIGIGTDNGLIWSATGTNVASTSVSTVAGSLVLGTPLSATYGGTGDAGGAWTPYTPTLACGAGTLTTAAATGRYKQIGKMVTVEIDATITTNGSCATYLSATLPVQAAAHKYVLPVFETANSLAGTFMINNGLSQLFGAFRRYNNVYPVGDGDTISTTGVYEAL